MKKYINLRAKAIEQVVIAYLVLTGLIILLGYSKLSNVSFHLFIRLVVLFLIGLLRFYGPKYKTNVGFKLLRLFWILPLMGFFYGETDYLNNLLFKENLDSYFANFEFSLFALQPAERFSEWIPFNWFAELMYLGYFSYYLLIIGIPVLAFLKLGPAKSERIVFIMANSFFLYYLFFILLPVAGPQFYFANSLSNLPRGYVFGYLVRSVQAIGEAPTGAFPSSHVSICLMILWFTFKNLKKWLLLVIPIALLLVFSTVYIKAHYLIDILAAFAVTPLVYIVSHQLFLFLTKKDKTYEPNLT